MECGLWRENKNGDDFLVRRFSAYDNASKVYDQFWQHPAALKGARSYYVEYQGESSPVTVALIRERPHMFIGDTRELGVLHLVLEIVSNSVDQYLQGLATQVWVQADVDKFEVKDDGAGFHRDKARQVLSHCHSSATADNHAPHIHLSSYGIGMCPVNALCSSFSVESFDIKGGWMQRYSQGNLLEEKPVEAAGVTVVKGEVDRSLFEASIPMSALRRKLFEAVHLLPGLKVSLNEETFYAPSGLLGLAKFDSVEELSSRTRFSEKREFGFNFDGEEISFSIACIGETDTEPRILSWVNGGRTEEHGTHVDGALEALKTVDWKPAVINLSVVMKEPQYAGPTKHRLGTEKVKKLVREALLPALAQNQANPA